MSDTSGGNVKRTVFLIILIIFAVMTPAWSEDLRITNIDYVLDLYEPYETFGFYEDSNGDTPIREPFPIKKEKQGNTPQFYYIVKSNHSGHKFTFNLSVSTFKHTENKNITPIQYDLQILDIENKHPILEKTHIDKDNVFSSLANYIEVTSSTKPQILGMEFYYIFDEHTLSKLAEGEYTTTVTMGVTVNE